MNLQGAASVQHVTACTRSLHDGQELAESFQAWCGASHNSKPLLRNVAENMAAAGMDTGWSEPFVAGGICRHLESRPAGIQPVSGGLTSQQPTLMLCRSVATFGAAGLVVKVRPHALCEMVLPCALVHVCHGHRWCS